MAVGAGLFYLARRLGLPWSLTLVTLLAPLVLLEVLFRWLVQQHNHRFDQRLMALLQTGENQELLPLYQRQLLLRFAAPRHLTMGKLGLIHARLGQHRLAAAAYREAVDDAPPDRNYTLALGLAGSLYELGEDQEAERVYCGAIDDDHINVQACANLARLLRKRSELEQAELYLTKAVEAARGGVLRCELVQLLIERGRLEDAGWHLRLAGEELAQADEQGRKALEQALGAAQQAGVEMPPAEPGPASAAQTEPPAQPASEE